MSKKSEAIKCRVEPLKKLALEQIAQHENLDLSDIVRKAIGEFLDKRTAPRRQGTYANS